MHSSGPTPRREIPSPSYGDGQSVAARLRARLRRALAIARVMPTTWTVRLLEQPHEPVSAVLFLQGGPRPTRPTCGTADGPARRNHRQDARQHSHQGELEAVRATRAQEPIPGGDEASEHDARAQGELPALPGGADYRGARHVDTEPGGQVMQRAMLAMLPACDFYERATEVEGRGARVQRGRPGARVTPARN